MPAKLRAYAVSVTHANGHQRGRGFLHRMKEWSGDLEPQAWWGSDEMNRRAACWATSCKAANGRPS